VIKAIINYVINNVIILSKKQIPNPKIHLKQTVRPLAYSFGRNLVTSAISAAKTCQSLPALAEFRCL